MANVKTFNLTIYMVGNRDISWRGISRVAVKRYIKYYSTELNYRGNHVEAR
jgi:hypothetical protein